jgi:membrane fusion protein, multidrug efflux system
VKAVGADDKVVQKRVVADTLHGSDWIVTSGLADGDRLVVLGFEKARPGAVVKVSPAPTPTAAPASNRTGGSGPSGEP